MGIQGLLSFIRTKFPNAIRTIENVKQYKNKTLAVDTTNWIYQFLIKTQTLRGSNIYIPTDSMGNQTGHLIGIMSRAAFCAQNNITPIWVFDGKPPQQKKDELKRRRRSKQQAEQKMETAIQQNQMVDLLKNSQRSMYITQNQRKDAQKLIQLMGFPTIRSPSQAQPQCAQLVKSGLAYATISQDTDTLTFGCPRVIRRFSKIDEIQQICLQNLLEELDLTYDQFVDFCILCGCDYTTRIKNIGPTRAYQYIKTYKNIDNLLQQIAHNDKLYKKHPILDQFNHLPARQLFKKPQILHLTQPQIKTNKFQQQQLASFLKNRQFHQSRIESWLIRIKKTNYYKQRLV